LDTNNTVKSTSAATAVMSFGRWYEEKKNEENGDIEGGSSWFGGADQLLPTFSTEGLQPLTWSGMKEAMESQMPKTILGMGYAQRFKVRLSLPLWHSATGSWRTACDAFRLTR
jgi:hypothetical protein